MPYLLLQNRKFNYTVHRKPIRSINLRLLSQDSFKVTCPRLTPDFVLLKFIQEHESWILKNSARYSTKTTLAELSKINILDSEYVVTIRHTTRDSVVIFQEENKIYINTSQKSELHLKKLLDAKFRPFALSLISAELKSLSEKFGFSYGKISVKNTTSRFGSCSSVGNLNFNWQIILFPQNLFRHVLLHELSHTIHHNHSSRFWSKLAECDPLWRQNRQLLRREGGKYFIV